MPQRGSQRHHRAARLLPQPDRRRPQRRAMARKSSHVIREKNLIAFIDMAYQGFADGIAEDAVALNLFAASGLQFLVSSSFSKSFSLYGERVGALTLSHGKQGRIRARALASQARHPHQLLQPELSWLERRIHNP
jgi:aspartate/methionine/tyrosine aminotransferase